MEVEAVDEGKVGKLLVSEGTEGVAVNAPIALLLEEGEDASALEGAAETTGGNGQTKPAPVKEAAPPEAPKAPSAPAPQATPAPTEKAAPNAPAASADVNDGSRVFASPLARRMAKQSGIDLSALNGSGPHGRVVKRDIEAALSGGAPQAASAPSAMPQMPAASAEPQPFEPEFELQPLSSMRKTIAQRLQLSKQTVPHFYLTVDCEIDALLGLRKRLNDKADGAFKLSVNDLIIKICGLALRKVPAANASYTDKGIKLYKSADVAVAVAIDGGLITPIIRDAANQGLEAISGASQPNRKPSAMAVITCT